MKTKLDILQWLDANGRVYYHGNDNMGTAFKSKLTKMYCYEFNGKILVSFKTFKVFIEGVEALNKKHGLEIEDF